MAIFLRPHIVVNNLVPVQADLMIFSMFLFQAVSYNEVLSTLNQIISVENRESVARRE